MPGPRQSLLACLTLFRTGVFPHVSASDCAAGTAAESAGACTAELSLLQVASQKKSNHGYRRPVSAPNVSIDPALLDAGKGNLTRDEEAPHRAWWMAPRSEGCRDNELEQEILFTDSTSHFNTSSPPSSAYTVPLGGLDAIYDARYGETVSYRGKIYAAPHNAQDLLVYDTSTDVVSTVSTESIRGWRPLGFAVYWLGITAYEGKIYAAPADAPAILVYDVESQILSGVPVWSVSVSTSCGWNGIAGWNGKVYAAPQQANQLLVYDISTDTVSGVPTDSVCTGPAKWMGLVAHNGKLYSAPVSIWSNCNQMLVYDTETGSVSGISTAGVATGEWLWHGMASLGNVIYAVPANANALLIYDVETGNVSGASTAMFGTGEHKWAGLTAHQGKLYGGPQWNDAILVYDPSTGNVSGYRTQPTAVASSISTQPDCNDTPWWNGIAGWGDKLYCAPYEGSAMLVYSLPQ